MERLQKVLARAGIASRRDCEALIAAGHVAVNGQIVTEMGTKVEPGVDILAVDGKPVLLAPALAYIMLNKPAGYVSTTDDPQGRPTVLDLLGAQRTARLYPVGRLDAASEGLLLLTNDGALTERLTHPRYGLEKEYLAWVDGRPAEAALARLRAGIPLHGKPAPVDSVEIVAQPAAGSGTALLRIVVHEGRKHEIRRLCDAIGHPVQRLQRVRMGPLRLGSLAAGAARPLTEQEKAKLQALASTPPASPLTVRGKTTGQAARAASRSQHADHPQEGDDDHHHRRPGRSRQERTR